MTHKDIYTKFMIEYDKANVTSSYPSLTEYEIATVLDKAYLALIAQKITGNNVRRVGFENDIKVTEDIAPLITRTDIELQKDESVAENVYKCELNKNHLYYVDGYLSNLTSSAGVKTTNKWSTIIYKTQQDAEFNSKTNTFTITVDKNTVFGKDGIELELSVNNVKVENEAMVQLWKAKSDGSIVGSPCSVASFYQDLSKKFSIWYNKSYLPWVNDTRDFDSFGISVSYKDINKNDSFVLSVKTKTTITSLSNSMPMDGYSKRNVPLQLVPHNIAKKFFITPYNMPWVKNPVCYIEGGDNTSSKELYVVVDPINTPTIDSVNVVYVKRPNKFAKDLDEIINRIKDEQDRTNVEASYFDIVAAGLLSMDAESKIEYAQKNDYTFECNDTMAEELISLAISFALENVESSRLNAKLNMRGLEA